MLDEYGEKKERKKNFPLVCFHFSSMKENRMEAAMDGTQILVGEVVRECLGALKCVQVQMHYI